MCIMKTKSHPTGEGEGARTHHAPEAEWYRLSSSVTYCIIIVVQMLHPGNKTVIISVAADYHSKEESEREEP